jgi:hypothetical protein
MAHDVFISHSVKDKATADAVCATLESNGIRCWIAPRDVTPGMEWGASIIGAIEQCRVMVLVFTANANASPQIHREVERAVNHGVAILPLRVEDVLPGKSLEYFISDVHWLDALTPPLEAHLRKLAETIRMLLAPTEPYNAKPAPTPEQTGRIGDESSGHRILPFDGRHDARAVAPRFWGIKTWAWAGGVLLALMLCAAFLWLHPRPAPSPGATTPPAPTTPPASTAPQEWVGFANDTSKLDQEHNLTINCGPFHRVSVAGAASSFDALCSSIGETCVRVCDWQGATYGCEVATRPVPNQPRIPGRDGSRIALCAQSPSPTK